MNRKAAALVATWLAWGLAAQAGEPAVVVRLERPDEQLARWLALFEGARAPHPAAALAAWKTATGDTKLSKLAQSLIAMGNPQMVPELRLLDGAEVRIGFDADGAPAWWATVPRDDGTLAALATALALTDGTPLPPLGGARVDRLGPGGAPLLAQDGGGRVALAADRDALSRALGGGNAGPRPAAIGSGLTLAMDPAAVPASSPPAWRRVAGGLRAAGCQILTGQAALEGNAVTVRLRGRIEGEGGDGPAVEPGWLDWIPVGRAAAAVALALDPGGVVLDRGFAVLDAIERADPSRAEAGPLRARLNLLALAAGVRPEVELWPNLEGVTACLLAEGDGAIVVLHAVGDEAAGRLAGRVVPRLAGALVPGTAGDRTWRVVRRGRAVVLGWGPHALEDAIEAAERPDASAGSTIRLDWCGSRPSRCGALWPGRMPGAARLGAEAVQALDAAPPVLWWGGRDEDGSLDVVRWGDLDTTIRRYLDRLPLETPGEP